MNPQRRLENMMEERMALKQEYNSPEYKPLRYTLYSIGAVMIITLLCMLIWLEQIPVRTLLAMRGCVGVLAIIFFILVGVLTYKVYSRHIRNRHSRRVKSNFHDKSSYK